MGNAPNVQNLRICSVLTGIEDDRRSAAQSNKIQRLKLKRGEAALIRLLPFPVGKRGLPYSILAQHWINKKPCFCKQYTHPDFGGNPDYQCPLCAIVVNLHAEATTDEERDTWYDLLAKVNYNFWCLVFKTEDDRGHVEEMDGAEIFIPQELSVSRSAFPLLSTKIERSKSRSGGSVLGLFDLETGCDIWVQKDKKNSMTFDLSEDGPGSIFTLDDQFEANLAKVWKHLKEPIVKFFEDDRMNAIADKVAERAFSEASDEIASGRGDRSSRGTDRGGGGRNREHDDGGSEVSRGRSRGDYPTQEDQTDRPARPMRSTSPAPDRDPVLTRTSAPARSAVAPSRTSRFQQARQIIDEAPPAPEDDSNPELAPEQDQPQDQPQDQGQEAQDQGQEAQGQETAEAPAESIDARVEEQAPAVRRQVGARPVQSSQPTRIAAPSAAVNASRRVTNPPVARPGCPTQSYTTSRPTQAASPENVGPADENENLPEEAGDPAPPDKAALPPRGSVTPAMTAPARPANELETRLRPRIVAFAAREALKQAR